MQRRQFFEDRGVGAVGPGLALFAAGEAELFEQHVAQLLGRADIEGVADRRKNRLLEFGDPGFEGARQFGESGAVDLDPGILHRGNDRRQRPFDRLVERGHPLAHQPRLQQHMQPQRGIGALGGEIADALGRHLGKGNEALAGADELLQRGQGVLERALDQRFDVVVEPAAVEHIGQQHRAVIGRQRHAPARQEVRRGLDVMSDLEHARIGQKGPQLVEDNGG